MVTRFPSAYTVSHADAPLWMYSDTCSKEESKTCSEYTALSQMNSGMFVCGTKPFAM
jgi:hypothetical protein